MSAKCRSLLSLLCGLSCLALLPAGGARAEEAPTQVRVTTNMGEFVIELRADRAPLTTANFLRYVREGFYSNTLIQRVVANFVVQGGGFDATTQKVKPTHENVVNESGNGLQNKRGAVGMARGESPHTSNSQFFVNLVDNPDLDPVPTRWGYAVFGKVVQGMDVVDRIGAIPTGAVGAFKSDSPLKPVIIEKVEVVGAAAAAAPVETPVNPAPPSSILSPK
ncbi:MAG: peptidylprolyl isomerase [Gammaproteobacteria bacterium]|nr:peptidylprolyl isomerase [Gammaproteobacteria bacterium]